MGRRLTGGQHQALHDQIATHLKRVLEIQRQIGQPGGYPFDPDKLRRSLDTLNRQMDAIMEGGFAAVIGGLFPCQIHVPHLIPETKGKKWEVIEDVGPSDFSLSDLKYRSFLKGDETVVSGDTMRQRAVELGAYLGLSDAPRLLEWLNQFDEVPGDLQGKYISLPGTVLRSPDGNSNVPYLDRGGDCWILNFHWLDDGWDDDDRLACYK